MPYKNYLLSLNLYDQTGVQQPLETRHASLQEIDAFTGRFKNVYELQRYLIDVHNLHHLDTSSLLLQVLIYNKRTEEILPPVYSYMIAPLEPEEFIKAMEDPKVYDYVSSQWTVFRKGEIEKLSAEEIINQTKKRTSKNYKITRDTSLKLGNYLKDITQPITWKEYLKHLNDPAYQRKRKKD